MVCRCFCISIIKCQFCLQLCQLMMDDGVFEPLGSKSKRAEIRFEDCTNKYFRFVVREDDSGQITDESSSGEKVPEDCLDSRLVLKSFILYNRS